jgi:F0F1-type ATP synthase membrane subunit b/b'
MARALLLALMVVAGAPATLAFAETEAEETAEEVAEEHEEGGHHGGPVTIESILHDTHFWAAVINFTLLLIVLRKLGGKGISEFLKARRATMEASINEAAEIKAKAEAKHQEYTARLATLDAELAKLKSDLESAAVAESKRITAEAEESAKRAKAETQSLIEQHAQALAAEVRREVVEAAVIAAHQVIAGSVNADDQQKLADGFRQRIETLASKAGRPSRAPMGGQS